MPVQIILPLKLHKDGIQEPFDVLVSPEGDHRSLGYQAICAPMEPACWAPPSLFKYLRLFPIGLEYDPETNKMAPRYVMDLKVLLPNERKLTLERLRVYADQSDSLNYLVLGQRVCDAVARLPAGSR